MAVATLANLAENRSPDHEHGNRYPRNGQAFFQD